MAKIVNFIKICGGTLSLCPRYSSIIIERTQLHLFGIAKYNTDEDAW